MTTTRTHARLILIALALLGLGWALAPRSAPPLYDGVGFPDEPYRFVVKPDGAPDTKAPTVAKDTVALHGGQSDAVHAQTAEQAPQLAFLVPVGRLHAPAGTAKVVVTATATKPIAAPSGGYLWSNVYDITADNGATMTDGKPAATITMRAATGQRPVPTIERYVNGRWTALTTLAVGSDIYEAELPGLGRYAVIGSSPLSVSELKGGTSAGSGTNKTGIAIAVAAVLVVIGLAVVGTRRRRARRAEIADGDSGEEPDDEPDNGPDAEPGARRTTEDT